MMNDIRHAISTNKTTNTDGKITEVIRILSRNFDKFEDAHNELDFVIKDFKNHEVSFYNITFQNNEYSYDIDLKREYTETEKEESND